MPTNYINKTMIEKLALSLGELNERMLYVGGSIIGFYTEDEGAMKTRPTEDIDLAISVPTYNDWIKLEEELRKIGISKDPSGSLCRFTLGDILLDVMPIESIEIGPVNRWYLLGLDSAVETPIGKTKIRILSAPYFVATKFEAFNDRGDDMRLSHDIEDVIFVVDSRPAIVEEIMQTKGEIKDFLVAQFEKILKNKSREEIISAHLEMEDRFEIVRERISKIIDNSADV